MVIVTEQIKRENAYNWMILSTSKVSFAVILNPAIGVAWIPEHAITPFVYLVK